MRAVGLKILKNKLSEYVRMASNGETVLVTDHDRVVAELNPPGASRAENVTDATLADLVRRGLIRPALRRRTGPVPRATIPGYTLDKMLEELDEDRRDRP